MCRSVVASWFLDTDHTVLHPGALYLVRLAPSPTGSKSRIKSLGWHKIDMPALGTLAGYNRNERVLVWLVLYYIGYFEASGAAV